MKNSTKKEIRAWLILAAMQLSWIIPFTYAYTHQETTKEATIKPLHIETVKQAEEATFYDVPLSNELQAYIFAECEAKNIAPEIIISIIEHESNYKPDAIGDDGEALGLMQIQPKWHKERMERLECTDLLNPYENIKVGIDIICELINDDPDLYYVLIAYNGGRYYANKNISNDVISGYALEVAARASELTESIEN